MATAMAEDSSFEDDQLASMRFASSRIQEELQRTNLELDSYKEKIKENQEKIKLNKQLPYLVGNIVELLGEDKLGREIHGYVMKTEYGNDVSHGLNFWDGNLYYYDNNRKLSKYVVTATLQCAVNRRTAMSNVKEVKGVGWDVSAIGNAVWGGAKLADVLELVGIAKWTSTTKSGGKHVEFVSIDKCKEENGGPYKASIPLNHATSPEADVLLAYEMNGEVKKLSITEWNVILI
uniref:Oxidoreductase molybdopterin-binding domain-containing protein n=1 Tax=Manihot esculenta TaxID=3983 RepID=A0A2C9UZZ3_MANES